MGKCRDGVDLPDYGPCPICGATADQTCRGRAYGEMMAKKAAQDEEAKRNRAIADVQRQMEATRDQRTERSDEE